MKILIVEDDYLQADWLSEQLRSHFCDSEIECIFTESKFRQRFSDEIVNMPPDIVLIDVMLRWADPSPNLPSQPPEVKAEGFYRAGFRCQQLLTQHPKTKRIPVLLYTVLPREDLPSELPPNVKYLQKGTDPKLLINYIRSLLQGLP